MDVIQTQNVLPQFRSLPQVPQQPFPQLSSLFRADMSDSKGSKSSSKKRSFSQFVQQQSGKRSATMREGEKNFGTPGEFNADIKGE
jgi:hypothetical protein